MTATCSIAFQPSCLAWKVEAPKVLPATRNGSLGRQNAGSPARCAPAAKKLQLYGPLRTDQHPPEGSSHIWKLANTRLSSNASSRPSGRFRPSVLNSKIQPSRVTELAC